MFAFTMACGRSRSRSVSRSRSIDSRDRKHHSHKKAKKRHRSRSPDSPYHSYPISVEKHKKVGTKPFRCLHTLAIVYGWDDVGLAAGSFFLCVQTFSFPIDR